MKYILTESQYNFLVESDTPLWFRRRANKESMSGYIQKAVQEHAEMPYTCDSFGDEFDYADKVIESAVTTFLTTDEDLFESDDYDDINDSLTNLCKDWFGEYLFDLYRSSCPEENKFED